MNIRRIALVATQPLNKRQQLWRMRFLPMLLVVGIVAVFGGGRMAFAANTWQQLVEEGSGSSGTRATGWYTTTDTCDVGDPDTDYVFAFQIDARNPDGLRFRTTNAQVATALPAALNSYGLNWYEARVCVGENTVWWAGGPDHVFNNLYLYNS